MIAEDEVRRLLAKAKGDHARLQVEGHSLTAELARLQAALAIVRRDMVISGAKITAYQEALGELEGTGEQEETDGRQQAPPER
jgi:hypothetical protein